MERFTSTVFALRLFLEWECPTVQLTTEYEPGEGRNTVEPLAAPGLPPLG